MFHITTRSKDVLPEFSVCKFLRPWQIWSTSRIYTKLDLDRRQIRLASILPGRWSDDVSCKLTVVSLDDEPKYEALSYTWGDPLDKVPILLEGVTFPVTKTLKLALRRLRNTGETRQIWIDALSINQSDKPEKTRQIQMMKEIYSGATTVQVYLGESRVLETISEQEQATWAEPPRSYRFGDNRDWSNLNDYGTWQPITDDQLSRICPTTRLRQAISIAFTILIFLAKGRCLQNFLDGTSPRVWAETLSVLNHIASSPWWKRVWVVEEVILSRRATITVIYGEVIVPLDSVERGGSKIPVHIKSCCRDFFQNLSNDGQSYLLAIAQRTAALEGLRHEWEYFADTEAVRLYRFLGLTRSRGAYDARDKIYSLLGLTKDCSENLSIVPDYSASVSQVYINTAFKIIHHMKSLEILTTAEKKRMDSEIPTWCPNWSISSNGEENDLWIHSRAFKFNAGPSNENVANLCHDRVLAVKGVHIDVVAETTLPLSKGEDLAPRLDEFSQLARYNSEPQAPYVTGGTLKEAFWRTMLNDALEPEPNKHENLIEGDESFFLLWWKTLKDGSVQAIHQVIRRSLEPAEQQEAIESFRKQLRITARSFWLPNDHRVFFTTQHGYMGFGPPGMRQGDSVAILLGSKMPFILRQAQLSMSNGESKETENRRYWSVVGYCYLHGVMHGEAVGENVTPCDINLV